VPNQGRQRSFRFRTWGGKRRGAGAKLRGERPRVSHKTRPAFKRWMPVHVTVRMRAEVCHLRQSVCLRALKRAFYSANRRGGLQVVHFSLQGNHIHFLVEAEGALELARGMQGLNVRMAKALNRLMQRRGKVLADRYHASVLQTPTHTANALHYVLHNRQHHAPGRRPAAWRDPFASAHAPLAAPRTWLLRGAPVP
jgi:REP element-mobilizing transposase RayT